MNRKTITKEFDEVYGNGKNLNYKKNTSIPNMLNKIPDIENVTNNIVENYNKNYDKPISQGFVPFKFPYIPVLIIIIMISLISIVYYFKDTIGDFFNKIHKIDNVEKKTDNIIKKYNDDKQNDAKNNDARLNDARINDAKNNDARLKKLEEDTKKLEEDIKTKEQNNNTKNNNINNGGVNELNNAINNSTSYKKEQDVKENSFCYIGYDDGQRVCTNAFEGDICMSGQIFPKMDMCIYPRLLPYS
jgi:hypothetical protein